MGGARATASGTHRHGWQWEATNGAGCVRLCGQTHGESLGESSKEGAPGRSGTDWIHAAHSAHAGQHPASHAAQTPGQPSVHGSVVGGCGCSGIVAGAAAGGGGSEAGGTP